MVKTKTSLWRSMSPSFCAFVVITPVVLFGCNESTPMDNTGKHAPTSTAQKITVPVQKFQSTAQKALAAAVVKDEMTRLSAKECLTPFVSNDIPTTEKKTVIKTKKGNVTVKQMGTTLIFKQPGATSLKIGVLSDIKDDAPENLTNIKRFLSWFAAQNIDLIVVAGDSGLTEKQLVHNFTVLAGAQVPTFITMGNREGRAAFNAAFNAVAKDNDNLFALNNVRRIDTDVVDMVSLSGYWNGSFIHAEDGCNYTKADLQDLNHALATQMDSPVLLISHGSHKQTGAEAIDLTVEKEHAGDPILTRLMASHKIPFGIFGNIHEAGGRATDFVGHKVLAQKASHQALFLNSGPTDSIRWAMNDGTESLGMAAIMTLRKMKGTVTASYEIKRAAKAIKVAGKKTSGKK